MKCIYCDNSTHVLRTTKSVSGRRIVRHRQCDADPSHRFETEESVPPPALTSVAVRKSGSGQIGAEPFDRERLFKDISVAILRKDGGDDDRIDRVVTRTVILLERNLSKILEPLKPAEASEFPHLKGSIPDTVIAEIVENEMQRSSMRMQRLLYALSIRGRQDREGRKGWSDATEVLDWIGRGYSRLQEDLPTPGERNHAVIWDVRSTPDLPKSVVKKDGRSGRRPFIYDQFLKSINMAMLGRKDPEARSLLIANKVLTALQGQDVVHTSQLGVDVMSSLRHMDDIAYLRWATVLKQIPSVTAFTEEARGLVLRPSPEFSIRAV